MFLKYIPHGFHRKNIGINHFAFHVSSNEEVGRFYKEFLKPKGIKTLYNSPEPFPEPAFKKTGGSQYGCSGGSGRDCANKFKVASDGINGIKEVDYEKIR